jgi:hypothetical protein
MNQLGYNIYIHGNITSKLPVWLSLAQLAKMSSFSFYLFSFFFYKIREREGRTGPAHERGLASVGKREESEYGTKKCVHVCVNAKMIPVETVP